MYIDRPAASSETTTDQNGEQERNEQARNKLLEEYGKSVFEIVSGFQGPSPPMHLGTGWLTEDGRLVTTRGAIDRKSVV